MLGKLARWLRIIGYDALYSPSLDDASILELAKKENRLIITRDAELYRRAARDNMPAVFLRTQLLQQELRELSTILGIPRGGNAQSEAKTGAGEANGLRPGSRCPVCNGVLTAVERPDLVANPNIPEKSHVWRCTSCGKVYWHGSHWRGINMTLRRLGFGELVDNT